MMGNLRCTRDQRGWHDWRQGEKLSRSAISTNIVLIGSELTTLSGDTLEILLSRSVGIANLQKKTLLANWLTVELSDDFFTELTALETGYSQLRGSNKAACHSPSKSNTTAVLAFITKDSAGENVIVDEDSTKLLQTGQSSNSSKGIGPLTASVMFLGRFET